VRSVPSRHYFLLSRIRDGMPPQGETLSVRWVSLDQAKRLLERERDMTVLRGATRMITQLRTQSAPALWLAS
jgi:hypothetical protein